MSVDRKARNISFLKQIILSQLEHRKAPFCAYIYDLSKLKSHAISLKKSLPKPFQLFYAVKANSNERVLQVLSDVVDGFEVASLGEIEKVRKINQSVPVIFGGPAKTDDELEGALQHRVASIHIESIHELNRLNQIAQKKQQMVSILLRVNLQQSVPDAKMKMAGIATQFGMEEKEIPRVIELLKGWKWIRLLGFHFHAMSNNLNAKKHALFVDHCLRKVRKWERYYGLNISHVNLGGGFGINYTDPHRPFSWNTFMKELRKLKGDNELPHSIIFESGRYITSSIGYYAAEVLDIKKNHGKIFVILRGGTHHLRLPAAWKMNQPFMTIPVEAWKYPFIRPQVTAQEITIAGELCTPNDILARDVFVNQLRAGDIVLFTLAGAYSWEISHHDFLSHPHPDWVYI